MDEAPKPQAPAPALLTLIARHLATEEYTLDQIMERYKFDQDYYDTVVEPNPYFQRVLEEYTKEWHSLGSTPKRIAFMAAAALEEKLPELAVRMDQRSNLSDVVAVGKLFKELAGIAPPVAGAAAGSGQNFTINIDLGQHRVNLETKAVPEIVEEKLIEPPREKPGVD